MRISATVTTGNVRVGTLSLSGSTVSGPPRRSSCAPPAAKRRWAASSVAPARSAHSECARFLRPCPARFSRGGASRNLLSGALANDQGHQRFLRVQAVLGLVPHPPPRPLQHPLRDFLPLVRRPAVEDDCVPGRGAG